MDYKWSRATVLTLIIGYRSQECLWNTQLVEYTNRNFKDTAYYELFESLRKYKPGLTMLAMKNKIHHLRSQFILELRELSKISKVDVNYVPKPALWCFDQLSFLFNGGISQEDISSLKLSSIQIRKLQEMELDTQEEGIDILEHQFDIKEEMIDVFEEELDAPEESVAGFDGGRVAFERDPLDNRHDETNANSDSLSNDNNYDEKVGVISMDCELPASFERTSDTTSLCLNSSTSSSSTLLTSEKNKSSDNNKIKIGTTDTDHEIMIKALDNLTEYPSNKFSTFGISLANDLSEMDVRQAKMAKKIINDILYLGTADKLTNTLIYDNPLFK